jgi:hypothetical protein
VQGAEVDPDIDPDDERARAEVEVRPPLLISMIVVLM